MFFREVLIWRWLKHENFVPFVGATLENLQIMSGWMPNGDLTAYIKHRSSANRVALVRLPLIPQKIIRLIFHQLLDVAKGLDYIHNCCVIHGDIKGVNFSFRI